MTKGPADLRIALTADLHWGHARGKDEALALAEFVKQQPPDLLLLGGDIGSGPHFVDCLSLFDEVSCRKALVPGNHDIWVPTAEEDLDSLLMYDEVIPRGCAEHDFHYLDTEPLVLPEADLGIVGSINWYDYSWAIDQLRELFPDELDRLQSKRFTRGRHNDARFVRWSSDDVRFTARVVSQLEKHLEQTLARVGKVLVLTHHPTFYDISFPREGPPTELDHLLWDAFGGNRSLEEVLARHASGIAYAFCGHTHRQAEGTFHDIQGHNIGADYPVKRLVYLDWPSGTLETHVFGSYE